MKKFFAHFRRSRRAAVAFIFAGCLLPLTMLIGLSIDYSFYVQARSQFSLAGDAAATYAIREATAAYALNGSNATNADAIGQSAGAAYFNAQLASLPTATTQNGTPTVLVTSNANNGPAGFTATVNYVGYYPPFFNGLFGQTKQWNVIGVSGATSQYSYAEVLVLLDTSGSMAISADAADALTMEDNTVCFSAAQIPATYGFDGVSDYIDPTNLVNWTNVANIKAGTSGTGAQCQSGFYGPKAPCAFACHTNPNTVAGGYTGDFYGEARRLGVRLKADVVFSAMETIISTMENSEQVQGQLSFGAYQFNDDACPMISGGAGDPLPEATGNLTNALTTINGDDYNVTPSETAFPPLVNNGETDDFTNFPQAVRDLTGGHFKCLSTTNANAAPTVTTGTALPSSNATTAGTVASNPQKNIFIISDGLSDTSGSSACGRYMGEITGATAEANGIVQNVCAGANGAAPTASCQALKNLGFTVYVLDVSYPAVVVHTYYANNSGGNNSNTYMAQDFPTLTTTSGQGTPNTWNTVQNGATYTPLQLGMQACASGPTDFYLATNSASITADMQAMLSSALNSATRLTQ